MRLRAVLLLAVVAVQRRVMPLVVELVAVVVVARGRTASRIALLPLRVRRVVRRLHGRWCSTGTVYPLCIAITQSVIVKVLEEMGIRTRL